VALDVHVWFESQAAGTEEVGTASANTRWQKEEERASGGQQAATGLPDNPV
jgi:hypothetical protein